MTFTTTADRSRAAAPTSSLMKTPAHLEALVTSVSRPMAWRHTTARDLALETARRDRKRREKLASLEIAMKYGIKHLASPASVPSDPVWHTGLSYMHHPFRAKRLIYAFCQVTGMEYKWMTSKGRRRKISIPRHILMWILKKHTGKSLPCIGRMLGGRDHSTILYGVRKVSNDAALLAVAEEIEKSVLEFERDNYATNEGKQ